MSTFYILRVRDDAVILPEYLAWLLNVAARKEIVARELQGTTMTFVPKEALATLEVDLPPTAVQQRVVALDTLMRRERELAFELLKKRAHLINAVARRFIALGEERA
ncbi:MAG: hypothetical protein QME79_00130 [Bacillota bacterium]|nr:hypothetical protein [Bacillota bacterium]